ncbi:MAG: hypothetical protein R3C26_05940 [Calditrichia bacterium]
MTATFGDTSFTSDGNYDVFVAKYAANGDFMWAQQEAAAAFLIRATASRQTVTATRW